MTFTSWNVNSLRNCEVRFLEFLAQYKPDIVAIQELRAHEDQLSFFLKTVPGYSFLFNDSGRPGYGGTALYYNSSLPVEQVTSRIGNKLLDSEGRIISFIVHGIHCYNFYTPNGNSSIERLQYKLAYYAEILSLVKSHRAKHEPVIIGGDLNVAAMSVDTFYKNSHISGYLPEERAWFSDMIASGMFDTLRKFHTEPDLYSWWNLRDPTRSRNEGWRFDYFLASNDLFEKVIDAGIHREVFGSDHCPVWMTLSL